ncbi:MAG: type II/IV secretion system protein, partial [Phycisphaerae bacterium]
LGIFELLHVDEEIRELIVQRRSAGEMLAVARRSGHKLMREDGWAKALKGITTAEEILRVTKTDVGAVASGA